MNYQIMDAEKGNRMTFIEEAFTSLFLLFFISYSYNFNHC